MPSHSTPQECQKSAIDEDIPFPAEWQVPAPFILRIPFQMLCMMAYGHNSLERYYRDSIAGERVYMEAQDRLVQRITTMTVMVSDLQLALTDIHM